MDGAFLPSGNDTYFIIMDNKTANIEAAANWIATALQQAGYHADLTPASLWEIDRFLDDNVRNGQPIADGLLAQDPGKRVFALGCYIGETFRRTLGGEWVGDTGGVKIELNIALRLPDGHVLTPVQRVATRIQHGLEDGIAAYGIGLGLDVGPPPTKEIPVPPPLPAKKPWWKVW